MGNCIRCGRSAVLLPGRRHCRFCQRLSSRKTHFRRRFVRLEQMARRRALSYGCYVEVVDYSAIYGSSIGGPCYICGSVLDHSVPLEFHHIVDLVFGGPHIASNVVLVHRVCNRGCSARLFLLSSLGR